MATHAHVNQNLKEDMRRCIEECTTCAQVCTETVMHCLQMGGKHAEPSHIRTLLDCAEICRTSANFMLRESDMHPRTCEICAEVCERCAQSCESFKDDRVMQQCAEVCRSCAASCRDMARGH